MCQSTGSKKNGESSSSDENGEEDEGANGERRASAESLSSEHYKQLVFPEGYNTNTYSVASRTGSIGTGSLLSRKETLRNIESPNNLSFEPIPEEDGNVDRESNVDRNTDFRNSGLKNTRIQENTITTEDKGSFVAPLNTTDNQSSITIDKS